MDSIEAAIKMETDAISFYLEAAGKTALPAAKKMFRAVAEEEKRHIRMVSDLINGLPISNRDTMELGPAKTIFEDLGKEMLARAAVTRDDLEAFTIAMRMETEGIDFYSRILQGAKTGREKKLLEVLVSEEREHYRVFADTHQFLSDSANWFMREERSIVEGG